MKIMRSKLLAIYSTLNNETKNQWALSCSYPSAQSLYNYLNRNDFVADENIISNLISTISENEFYSPFLQLHNINLRAIYSNSTNIDFNIVLNNLKYNIQQLLQCTDPDILALSYKILSSANKALEERYHTYKYWV